MSALVISGDSSGTITLDAPAVAGSTTQSLVAVSGTLAPIVSGTAVSASGTSVDFTGIPSWVKRITVMFSGLSTNNTGVPLVQLGTSGGYEVTGYSAMSSTVTTTNNTTRGTTFTSGFPLTYANGATEIYSGSLTLSLLGSNIWVCMGVNFNPTSAATNQVAGSKTLSNTLTSLRLYIDGTQQFDAGSINILYE